MIPQKHIVLIVGLMAAWWTSPVMADTATAAADSQVRQPIAVAQSTLGFALASDSFAAKPASSFVYVSDADNGDDSAPASDAPLPASDNCDACGTCDGNVFCEQAICCHSGGFCFRGDYMLMWTRGARIPPLVSNGVLGAEGTQVLFGNSRVNEGGRSNYRIRMGYWFGCCSKLGIEGDYFDTGGASTGFSEFSTGDPVLGRPIFNVQTGQDAIQIVAAPDIAVGRVDTEVTDQLMSAGVYLRRNLCCFQECCGETCCDGGCGGSSCGGRSCGSGRIFSFDLLGGYRYYRLNDRVTIHENLTSTRQGGLVQIGTNFDITDNFRSLNEFQGAEIGFATSVRKNCWSIGLLAKAAFGNNSQLIIIDGSTTRTIPGQAAQEAVGGLLAVRNDATGHTNIGRYRNNDFVVIPQFEVELAYHLSECARVYVGYNYLYWAKVARAGEHIDLRLDPRNLPWAVGAADAEPFPAFNLRRRDYWAQGLTVGMEVCF